MAVAARIYCDARRCRIVHCVDDTERVGPRARVQQQLLVALVHCFGATRIRADANNRPPQTRRPKQSGVCDGFIGRNRGKRAKAVKSGQSRPTWSCPFWQVFHKCAPSPAKCEAGCRNAAMDCRPHSGDWLPACASEVKISQEIGTVLQTCAWHTYDERW